MRLAETIASFFGRVEVVLAGADGSLREGEEALSRGDPMRARAAAKSILAKVPGSPLGLALLSDACEAGHLDAELAMTLEELAGRVPSQADVWLRLGRVRARTGAGAEPTRDAFVRALSVAEPGTDARREALLWLADQDLAERDGRRAELWLERVGDPKSSDVAVRMSEARLLAGNAAGAQAALEGLEDRVTDGRLALARGRLLAIAGDPKAFTQLCRAMVLETPGSSELLSSTLAWIDADETTRARVRAVVAGSGQTELARWKAAFARAEGRTAEAREALMVAVRAGDRGAAEPLLESALDDRDTEALAVALGALRGDLGPLAEDARRIPTAARLKDPGETEGILEALSLVVTPRAKPWARAASAEALGTWIPKSGEPAEWTRILTLLDRHARELGALDLIQDTATLAVERAQPVRVAIVGEFNAGKSTLINAIMGEDVAPTGIVPTTATLHHLRYAPSPYVRIRFMDATPERIVASGELREVLDQCDPASVLRVEILKPIDFLTRLEILDTPGFNAPDPRHADAARRAFEEADCALWLLDATQALKQSERRVLEEAKSLGLPVQMLLNKADRLDAEQREHVRGAVEAALSELSFATWAAPVLFSAKLSLKGRLGDERALEASGWSGVQTLLDQELIGRTGELKERGLRRRARRVSRGLLGRARAEAQATALEQERIRGVRRFLAARGAELGEDRTEAAQMLAGALAEPSGLWRRDLEVVVTGRDGRLAKEDLVLSHYRAERAVSRLAEPTARILSRMAQKGAPEEAQDLLGTDPQALMPVVRAVVRAFACAGGTPEALAPMAQAAVQSLVDHLRASSERAAPTPRAEARVGQLEALEQALA